MEIKFVRVHCGMVTSQLTPHHLIVSMPLLVPSVLVFSCENTDELFTEQCTSAHHMHTNNHHQATQPQGPVVLHNDPLF